MDYNSFLDRDWGIGDTVEIKPNLRKKADHHGKFVVKRFLQKNVEVEKVGSGLIMRGRPTAFQKVVTSSGPTSTTTVDLPPTVITPVHSFELGEVVTVPKGVASNKWQYPAGQKFVVIKTSLDRVNIAKMGGEGGRYWRMNPSSLELCTEF